MKSIILSSLIAVVALFSANVGVAQNAHFVKGPCISGRSITATIAGLGAGPVDVRVTGDFICANNGGNEPAPKSFDLTQTFDKRTGGNFKLNFSLSSLCPNRNWTFRTDNVTIIISQGGTEVLRSTDVPTCQ